MRSDKVLTKVDCERLHRIIEGPDASGELDGAVLNSLRYYLSHSRQVEPQKIRSNIVTMNSKFLLTDIGNGKNDVYSLVFPHDADITKNRISVLSRIGMQILGSSAGTVIKSGSANDHYLLIEKILYQPEAAGDNL